MLGRRQLREKVMQGVYSYKLSGQEKSVSISNFLKGIDEIHDLYIYLMNLLLVIRDEDEKKLERRKTKKLPTPEDLNPNMSFVNNKLLVLLSENKDLNRFSEKNKKLLWGDIEVYPSRILASFRASEEFKIYTEIEKPSFKDDKKIVLFLYEAFIADNESLHDFIEGEKLHWSDSIYIANSMVVNTLDSFHANCSSETQLFRIFKDEEDKRFALSLLETTIDKIPELDKIIEEKAQNWKLDRIAAIDLIVLEMGLCELLYFPDIPAKVSLNEYVELVKNYSTEKSKIFVNGILDKVLKEYREEKKIMK